MANLDITIKRKNGAGYDILYPTTIISQVDGLQTALDGKINTTARGAANGVASLGADGKIPVAQLPNEVFDNLKFAGIMTSDKSLAELAYAGLFTVSSSDTTLPYVKNIRGMYWVVAKSAGTAGSIVVTANDPTAVEISGYYFITSFVGAEEDRQALFSSSLTLENGDWIVITGLYGEGTLANPYKVNFGVVNNTYENATTTIKGIVTLSSSTSTATTGNNVITDGILNGLVTTTTGTANKIAASAHNHDSAYLGISANAVSASKWATARTITLNGDASGSVSIDGSADVTLSVAVADNSHNHTFSNITSTPTTISGYGITDAYTKTEINTFLTSRPEIYYNASADSDGDLVLDLDSDGDVA